MPAGLVLEERDALAFHRARDDRGGPARVARLREGVVDLSKIVAIDDERIPAERLDARGVRIGVPLELGGPALAEPVHVEDGRHAPQVLVTAEIEAFPDRALGALAVADDRPYVERRVPQTLRRERDPDRDRHALTERARRDVDPRQHRCGMTLEARAQLTERHELAVV